MKTKRISLFIALFLCILGIQAQEWRGFLELTAGTSPAKSDINIQNKTFSNVCNPLSFGLNYTMGVQVIPQLYAGAGIGGYTALLNYDREYGPERVFTALYFPVFVNARWIPDITKKINPFVDLKIGYQMGLDLDNIEIGYSYSYDSGRQCYIQHKNGMFLQPGVGVRFGRDSAFNLGIAYNVSMRREFVCKDLSQQSLPIVERISKNYGFLMVTFGADF